MRFVARKPRLTFFVAIFLLAAAFAVAQFVDEPGRAYTALEKTFYLSAQEAVWTRPGLKVTIQNVTIGTDRKPVVTFKLGDRNDVAIDREGKFTPGAVSTSFILAYIPQNGAQHVDYSTRTATGPVSGTVQQAAADSGGTYTSLGDGLYTYTFRTVLPANYDTAATHTLGIYATRNLTEFGLSLYVANTTLNFVPNGSPVTKIREVVSTKACNACHNPLSAHGSTGRQTNEICILCHTPQSIDPDTGNTVDMKVMTHKIHMGSSLPSVKAGKPYQIIGRSPADYSKVVFPMDIRNCQACHKDAAQVDNWLNNPTADTCGSCHDEINFKTGENHAGGPQPSDKYCSYCHWDKSDWEYDATISGAHTVPYKSLQLRNPKVEIVSVTNLGPGLKPTVNFKLTDRLGNPVKVSDLARLTFRFAGPTGDYRWNVSERAEKATTGADGVSTYAFTTQVIPADASGSCALEVEGYITSTLNPGTVKAIANQRDVIDNVIRFYAVTGTTVTPRRTIVDDAKCDKCHDKLWFHGGNRNNAQSCALCHNPTLTDSRPADKGPKESIDLKVMVHKIHSGEELTKDYSIIDREGKGPSYNEVLYPGDRRDCLQCHMAGSYTVPVAATATPVTWPALSDKPVMPTTAACLTCHDSTEAAAHAFLNVAPFGEACAVCHKEAADASVSKSHAR